jgi:hypothetical protein
MPDMRLALRIPVLPLALLSVLLALAATGVFAENIVAMNQYAYSERVGWINFKPGTGPGITVTNSDITGYAWGERIGWISMSCHNDEPGITCASRGNWEVTNDGGGHLKGYAWSERDGWISFSCKNTNSTCSGPDGNWGVTISPTTGVFTGQAWGERIGWITFSCPGSPGCGSVAYSVVTSWRGSAASVGGIAERPDVATLPSAGASSGNHHTAYALSGIALAAIAAIGAAGWYMRRKRAA